MPLSPLSAGVSLSKINLYWVTSSLPALVHAGQQVNQSKEEERLSGRGRKTLGIELDERNANCRILHTRTDLANRGSLPAGLTGQWGCDLANVDQLVLIGNGMPGLKLIGMRSLEGHLRSQVIKIEIPGQGLGRSNAAGANEQAKQQQTENVANGATHGGKL